MFLMVEAQILLMDAFLLAIRLERFQIFEQFSVEKIVFIVLGFLEIIVKKYLGKNKCKIM